MANLLSTGTGSAGYLQTVILDAAGNPALNTTVTVYQSDGVTVATLYTDNTKATTTPNPVTSDNYGNIAIYTNPGMYILAYNVSTSSFTKRLMVNPWYSDEAWNCYLITNFTALLSGDSVIDNATTNITVTSPASKVGARFQILNAETGILTVQASSGVFYGLGTGTAGLASFTLGQGGNVTAHCIDGTNWWITAGGLGPQATQVSGPTPSGNLSNNTITTFTGGTLNSNIGMNFWNTATGRMTVGVAGIYQLYESMTLSGNGSNPTTAYWQCVFSQNGTALTTTSGNNAGNFYGPFPSISGSVLVNANVGDYFTFAAFGSAAMSASVGFNAVYFGIQLVGGQV